VVIGLILRGERGEFLRKASSEGFRAVADIQVQISETEAIALVQSIGEYERYVVIAGELIRLG
jgi:hypothetical protein